MKAFVIKNKEGKYYKRYFDAGYVEFVDNFCFAELYTKKEGANDTKDFILINKYRFNIGNLEVVEITITEGDLEQENKQLKEQLTKRDKEIEKLYKIIDSQKRHITNTEKYFIGRGTKRTGNVVLDFELLIRKQVCDEIKKVIDYHSEWYEKGYVINMVAEDLLKEIDKIEQAKR